jgi:carbonic anhydrase
MLAEHPVSPTTPHLRDWLNLATPVLETLKKNYAHLHDPRARELAAAQENVLFALDNLHSYSCVQDRLMGGTLRLHAWFFKIATAELFAYDPEKRQFSPLVDK